jgi:hypothetical protein
MNRPFYKRRILIEDLRGRRVSRWTVSILALAVSALTAWLTLFRRGTVKMTQPTVIFFGPDVPGSPAEPALPKVYLRTLLVATAKRGRVIQSMYVSLSRDETVQNFNVWVYGDEKLVRGSGLFVGETGVAANHHFLIPREGVSFQFIEGQYHLKVYAPLLGDRKRTLLFSHTLEITRDTAIRLKEPDTGVYFDWGPDSSRYLIHVMKQPIAPRPEQFLELLGLK